MKQIFIALMFALFIPQITFAQETIDIAFPVQGDVSFSNDYDSPRSGGRTHLATDIMADKMTPIIAVTDGVITNAPMQEPDYGYNISLRGDNGYKFSYLHINNDTPGTDDGVGGPQYAYAPGIERGSRVQRGDLLGWVGDSGNAENVGAHLHFEMYDLDGNVMNPYESLFAAYSAEPVFSYDPKAELAAAVSINSDLDIPPAIGEVLCESNSLIRTQESSTVYYCGQNGARYAFQNESTYFSWYTNFDNVTYVTVEELGKIRLKGVVTYKPGTYLVKIPSSPKVYAVSKGGLLHYVSSSYIGEALYGTTWAKLIRDIPDSFFASYTVGEDVTAQY